VFPHHHTLLLTNPAGQQPTPPPFSSKPHDKQVIATVTLPYFPNKKSGDAFAPHDLRACQVHHYFFKTVKNFVAACNRTQIHTYSFTSHYKTAISKQFYIIFIL
jgi:hypothetical protein